MLHRHSSGRAGLLLRKSLSKNEKRKEREIHHISGCTSCVISTGSRSSWLLWRKSLKGDGEMDDNNPSPPHSFRFVSCPISGGTSHS